MQNTVAKNNVPKRTATFFIFSEDDKYLSFELYKCINLECYIDPHVLII